MAPSFHHVESLVNLPGRGLLSQLCEELPGQFSRPTGFHAKMIPSVQSIVQEANNLIHYRIRLSHLECGQKRRHIRTLCRQTRLFLSGPTLTILSPEAAAFLSAPEGSCLFSRWWAKQDHSWTLAISWAESFPKAQTHNSYRQMLYFLNTCHKGVFFGGYLLWAIEANECTMLDFLQKAHSNMRTGKCWKESATCSHTDSFTNGILGLAAGPLVC